MQDVQKDIITQILSRLDRPVTLIGMMGAGKTRTGNMLARKLGLDFFDIDDEIEKAADCTISEIFERFGETYFRNGERRVIARVIDEQLEKKKAAVISTGGGAVMTPQTAEIIWKDTISIWIRADMETTLERVMRNVEKRPMLSRGNPEEILSRLAKERYPVYEKADIVIDSSGRPEGGILSHMLESLHDYLYRTETKNDQQGKTGG